MQSNDAVYDMRPEKEARNNKYNTGKIIQTS